MMSWGLDGWIFLAVWVGALLAMVWLLRGSGRAPEPDPLQILRTRFARGEMNANEFEQARRLLEDR